MVNGHVVDNGTPQQVLAPDLLRDVFHVSAHCETHPRTGKWHLTFEAL